MPVQYKIYKTYNNVYITTSHANTIKKGIDILKKILADPAYKKGMNILENRLKVTEPATSEAVKSFICWVSQHEKKMGECKYARVVGKGSELLMARMGETLAEFSPQRLHRVKFRVFTTIKRACKWLEIKNSARYFQ
jgi:hypothetical protein